jgi:hypothetical protein
MMLGSDSGLTPATPKHRRGSTARPEGILFAMQGPIETESAFHWPSWLSPSGTAWHSKPSAVNHPRPSHPRSL